MSFESNGNWYKNPLEKEKLEQLVDVGTDTSGGEQGEEHLLSSVVTTGGRWYKDEKAWRENRGLLEKEAPREDFLAEEDEVRFDAAVTEFINLAEKNVIAPLAPGEQVSRAVATYEKKIVPALQLIFDKVAKEYKYLLGHIESLQNKKTVLSEPEQAQLKEYQDRMDTVVNIENNYEQEQDRLERRYDKLKSPH